MNNEPVAWMYKDEENAMVSFRRDTLPFDAIPLYTHPAQELNDGGEPVKNATYWKRQCNLLQSSFTNLQSSLYHANEQIKYLEAHPADLTDEEIIELFDHPDDLNCIDFARAILRKASEK